MLGPIAFYSLPRRLPIVLNPSWLDRHIHGVYEGKGFFFDIEAPLVGHKLPNTFGCFSPPCSVTLSGPRVTMLCPVAVKDVC